MKFWTKVLVVIFVVAVIIYGSLYLFLLFKGRSLIVRQLENLTKNKVTIGYFNIAPPLTIEIKAINIEGLANIGSLSISPSILGLLTGSLAFNEIQAIKPEFTFEQTPYASGSTQSSQSAPKSSAASMRLNFVFKRIIVKDGALNFIDRTISESGIKLVIKDINFKLTNLYVLPRSVITNFELKGRVPWGSGQEQGKIEAEGWLNLFKKDMQATLNIIDIDGIYLYPYYANWVNLEKARIEKARLNFTSNIHGLNNNVTADCHLELTDIVRKPRSPEEPQEKAERITDAVLDIFRSLNQGKIVLDFTIKTKMDRPEFGFGNIKMAFENKLVQGRKASGFQVEGVLKLPTNLLQSTVKSATDLTKTVIDGVASVGKELKKALEDAFSKKNQN